MFNLGFGEILVIGVLALILIGPKQLPEVAKVLGRMMKEFKQATRDLSGGLLDIKEELKKPMQEGIDAFHNLQQEVHNQKQEIVSQYHASEETYQRHDSAIDSSVQDQASPSTPQEGDIQKAPVATSSEPDANKSRG